MFFNWFKRRRRRKLMRRPFPQAWTQTLEANVAQYARLSVTEQSRLRDNLLVFAFEKNWEGCGGLAMNDEIKVTIASLACLMTLGFEGEYFDAVRSILVYPEAYVAPDRTTTEAGVVFEGEQNREGEAWYKGPVILSWADAIEAARGAGGGSNLVVHEFAHQLDMQNGREADGMPPLGSRQQIRRWQKVMAKSYAQLSRDCDRGHWTLLDCYGTTNEAEFFAVTTECFFERPREMLEHHAELYDILRDYYKQDPAKRRDG